MMIDRSQVGIQGHSNSSLGIPSLQDRLAETVAKCVCEICHVVVVVIAATTMVALYHCCEVPLLNLIDGIISEENIGNHPRFDII